MERPRARIGQADALRGLASGAVVLHHTYLLGLMGPQGPWFWRVVRWSPVNILVEGRLPVILFFVLSGVVLTRALERPRPWAAYAVARVARIWGPVLVALPVATVLAAGLGPPDVPGPWVARLWRDGFDGSALGARLLLIGAVRDGTNPVVWSLVHELRLSLIFPALLWVARRRFGWLLAGALVGHGLAWLAMPGLVAQGGMCPGLGWCRPMWGESLLGSVVLDGYFAVFFVAGMGIARRLERLERVGLVRSWRPIDTGWAGIALIAANGSLVSNDVLFGLSAVGLVWLACARRAAVLEWGVLRWLGRISFSLYLVHVPVLLALAGRVRSLLSERVGAEMGLGGIGVGLGVAGVVIGASVLVAWLFHYFIETPTHRLGRAAGRAIALRCRRAGDIGIEREVGA